MTIEECVELMKKKSENFALNNNFKTTTRLSITQKYELVVIDELDNQKVFDGVLLGTFNPNDNILQFPYHPENPAIMDEDREMYLGLKEYGEEIGIPELTELNISFNPFSVGVTSLMRNKEEPEIHRNNLGIIESYYTLEDLLAIAANYHNAEAIVPLNFQDFIVYVGVK